MVTTTINMHHYTRTSIVRAARIRETTQREIIVFLLKRLMSEVEKYQEGFTGVRYQTDIAGKGWHLFFIRFRKDEYEYFTDLRKLCKRSVAFLIAIAVEEYLHELIDKRKEVRYTYICFNEYSLARKVINGIVCWLRYWGPYLPPETGDAPALLIRSTCSR